MVRRAAALLGACVIVAAVVTPAGAAETEPSSAADQSLQDFGACLANRGAGDLLLLIDSSGSLRETDPLDERVTAATYLLEQMAATSKDAGFTIDVAIDSFDTSVDPVAPWTRLEGGTLGGLRSAVSGLAERDAGVDTDYWTALETARQQLGDRAVADSTPHCQAVAWFSDGKLDLERRTSKARARLQVPPYVGQGTLATEEGVAAAEQAAESDLCRPAGLADQLRAAGIWLFGVGLSPTRDDVTFSLMRSITTGTAGSGTCGALTDPSPGAFVLAADIDDLIFAFDRFAAPGRAPITHVAGICQTAVCAEQEHPFVLDDSIRSVHVLGSADLAGVSAYLVPPDGKPVPLPRAEPGTEQSVAVGQTSVGLVWESDKTLTLAMARGATWAGRWSLVFVDEKGTSPQALSRTQIRIVGDLVPTWSAGTKTVHVGEVLHGTTLGLADAAGKPVDPAALLGKVGLSVTLLASDGTSVPVATGLGPQDIAKPLDIDLAAVKPGPARVRLVLDLTTADAVVNGQAVPGTAFAPQQVDVPVTLLAPVDFPEVGRSAAFGVAEGRANLAASLTVEGPGCVWLDDASLTVKGRPAGIGDVAVSSTASSAETCVRVEEGATGALPLRLTTGAAGNGGLAGSVNVMTAPLDESERAVAVPVVVSADLRKPWSTPRGVLGFVVALVLGPGLPLALLYVLKARGARIPPRALQARAFDVTVSDGQVLRDDAPFALRDDDFVQLVPMPEAGARTLDVAGVRLATRVGLSPFGPAVVRVTVPGRLAASSERPAGTGKDGSTTLPLAVHNRWVLHVDPAAAPAATLVLLVSADSSQEARAALAARMADQVPHTAAALFAAGATAPSVPGRTTPGGEGSIAPDPWSTTATDAAPDADPWAAAAATDGGWGRSEPLSAAAPPPSPASQAVPAAPVAPPVPAAPDAWGAPAPSPDPWADLGGGADPWSSGPDGPGSAPWSSSDPQS